MSITAFARCDAFNRFGKYNNKVLVCFGNECRTSQFIYAGQSASVHEKDRSRGVGRELRTQLNLDVTHFKFRSNGRAILSNIICKVVWQSSYISVEV